MTYNNKSVGPLKITESSYNKRHTKMIKENRVRSRYFELPSKNKSNFTKNWRQGTIRQKIPLFIFDRKCNELNRFFYVF